MTQSGPLDGFSVIDFGSGLAGGIVGHILSDLGATITRAEPASGDPFYARYAAYPIWHRRKTIVTAATATAAVAALHDRLAQADLCIIGGEDHPGYDWRPDLDALARNYPRLVILVVTGGPFGTADANLPAIDLLVQARTGLVFEQFSDRPAVYAFPAGSYGAAFQGLIGAFAALCERERSGIGQIVRTSLVQGVLAWLSHDWYMFERNTPVAQDTTPKGARPLIFRCADGKYLHIILASTDARKHVYTILGVENPVPSLEEDPRGMPSITRGVNNYYDDVDMLQAYVDRWKRDDLLYALWAKGVSSEVVNSPGDPWDDEQVRFNQLIVSEPDGSHRVGLPFTFDICEAPRKASSRQTASRNAPPLAGVRVLDFGTFTAGPHASLALADLGASVIKVESLSGDIMRFYFLKYTASSRGKKVLALDIKAPEGRDIAMRLCLDADIVHHNFRPGVTKRLGIDVETLHQRKPELILLETAAYGITGPKAGNGGFDMVFHSYCGHSIQGVAPGQLPRNYRLPVVDFSAGMLGTVATLVAQYLKSRNGNGATITTSLLNCGLFLMSELIQTPDGNFIGLSHLNSDETGFHPAMRLYPARDAWIAIAAVDDAMADRLLNALDLSSRIATRRDQWDIAEETLLSGAIAEQSADLLVARLASVGVWAERCRENAKEEIFADAVARALPVVVANDDPEHGPYLQLGAQFSFSRSPMTVDGTSPARGQHTREILAGLGYTADQIANLYDNRITA
ncbi:CoA transferase [Sphingomonas oryzagri]